MRFMGIVLAGVASLFMSVSVEASGRFIQALAPVGDDVWIVIIDRSLRPAEVPVVAERLARVHGGTVGRVMTAAANGFTVRMSEAQARRLASAPGVLVVEQNGYWNLAAETSQWHLDRIAQPYAMNGNYSPCYTGAGVTAYVVDTGVAAWHSEFQKTGGGTKVLAGARFSVDNYPSDDPCGGPTNDESEVQRTYNGGHGTSVASLIAGNTVGVSPGVEIVAVKVGSCPINNYGYPVFETQHVAWGLDWIRSLDNPYRNRRPALVNMSFFNPVNDPLTTSVEHVINGLVLTDYDLESGRPPWNGIPVIVSANNKDESACNYSPSRMAWGNPTYSPGQVISAGGIRSNNVRWDCTHTPGDECFPNDPGSNYGQCVDLYAPGHNLNSATIRDAGSFREIYQSRSGTSFSSAIISGIVAQYLQQNPSLTPAQLWSAMSQRSVTLMNSGDPHGIGPIPFVQLPSVCQ